MGLQILDSYPRGVLTKTRIRREGGLYENKNLTEKGKGGVVG